MAKINPSGRKRPIGGADPKEKKDMSQFRAPKAKDLPETSGIKGMKRGQIDAQKALAALFNVDCLSDDEQREFVGAALRNLDEPMDSLAIRMAESASKRQHFVPTKMEPEEAQREKFTQVTVNHLLSFAQTLRSGYRQLEKST